MQIDQSMQTKCLTIYSVLKYNRIHSKSLRERVDQIIGDSERLLVKMSPL